MNPYHGDLLDLIGFPAGWPRSRHNIMEWCRAVCFAGYQPDLRRGSPVMFWLGAEADTNP